MNPVIIPSCIIHQWAEVLICSGGCQISFAEMIIQPNRAGRNWSKIVTPEVDRLFDLQRVEFDAAKRKQIVNDADKAGLGNYPNIVVQYGVEIYALHTSVQDFKPHVSPYTNHRWEGVWLKG